MSDKSESINANMDGPELRESWQGRALAHCMEITSYGAAIPKELIGAAVLSIIAHSIDIELMQMLLFAIGARGTGKPMLTTIARIDKAGRIVADYASRIGIEVRRYPIFQNEKEMEGAFRRIADQLHFTDDERVEFFGAVHKWCACDERLDPMMDRRDPDAKRLVLH